MLKYNNVEPSQWLHVVRRFFDTGYFSRAFGSIFVFVFLPLVSLRLSHFWFLFHFNRKKILNLSVLFLVYALYCAFQLQRRKLIGQKKSKLVNYKVKILSFQVKKLVGLVIALEFTIYEKKLCDQTRDVEAAISLTASASNRTWTLSHLWTCWQAWLSKPAAYDLQGHTEPSPESF